MSDAMLETSVLAFAFNWQQEEIQAQALKLAEAAGYPGDVEDAHIEQHDLNVHPLVEAALMQFLSGVGLSDSDPVAGAVVSEVVNQGTQLYHTISGLYPSGARVSAIEKQDDNQDVVHELYIDVFDELLETSQAAIDLSDVAVSVARTHKSSNSYELKLSEIDGSPDVKEDVSGVTRKVGLAALTLVSLEREYLAANKPEQTVANRGAYLYIILAALQVEGHDIYIHDELGVAIPVFDLNSLDSLALRPGS